MRKLFRLLQRFWHWLSGRPPRLQTKRELDVPETLEANTIYLIGEGEHVWAAAFICPCGCGEVVHLSLLQEGRPRWRVEEHQDGTASIMPSVWRTKGCRSHFFIRRGLVDWVPNRK